MKVSRCRENEPDDVELLDRVRAGDVEAYSLLYRRHARPALGYARSWSHDGATAEDLHAEAFSRTLCALLNGRGPCGSLKPYLYTVIRNVSAEWSRRDSMTQLVGDLTDLPASHQEGDTYLDSIEHSLAVKAFNTLPDRWRTVLWHSLVDDQGRGRVAAQLGIAAPAAASLAYRAREGLRQAYLQQHISRIESASCRPIAERLGAYTRNGLGSRENREVRGHLRWCGSCSALAEMLRSVNAQFQSGKARRPTHSPTPGDQSSPYSVAVLKSFMPLFGLFVVAGRGGDRSRGACPQDRALSIAARGPVCGRPFVSRVARSRVRWRGRPRSSVSGCVGGRNLDACSGNRSVGTRLRRPRVTARGLW
jgi:RNA polymerase sigma factor (sigma-70 family)